MAIFFTLAFPTDPTTSELTHPLVQMEVGFEAWCFTQNSSGTLPWPGIHSSVTEDKNFAIKKKETKKIIFSLTLCTSDRSLQELGLPCCQCRLSLVTVLDFLLCTRSFLTIFCKLFQELIWQGADHSGLIQKNT